MRWIDEGTMRQEPTDTPTAVVAALAERFPGAEIPGLQVLRPTLEDVYLSLIGETPAVLGADPDAVPATVLPTRSEAHR